MREHDITVNSNTWNFFTAICYITDMINSC